MTEKKSHRLAGLRRSFGMLLLAIAPAASATEFSQAPDTGLATWQVETDGVRVRLSQLGHDQIQAFYQARGFTAEQSRFYDESCIFMTVMGNDSSETIEHQLSDWRYVPAGGQPLPIRSKPEWDDIWKKMGVKQSARIAFNWAQFPQAQTFSPGDWNQGMTTYQLPRGQAFDLIFKWRSAGREHMGKLENVRCLN